ncbi:MAG TPA: hypothetical protein VMR49_00145 [Candidatus Paceibacterota bacterium]|nr:hypothetical protein [Candidatus Paceibacterota bacterium]
MIVIKEFWKPQQLVVVRVNIKSFNISLLKKLMEEIKKDFTQLQDEQVIIENFNYSDHPEYPKSWGVYFRLKQVIKISEEYKPKQDYIV